MAALRWLIFCNETYMPTMLDMQTANTAADTSASTRVNPRWNVECGMWNVDFFILYSIFLLIVFPIRKIRLAHDLAQSVGRIRDLCASSVYPPHSGAHEHEWRGGVIRSSVTRVNH